LNDPVHDFLSKHEKPLYAICGAYHALANSLGYKIKDTGKFNIGKGEDGHMYNHKYGLAADDLEHKAADDPSEEEVSSSPKGELVDIETIDHQGEKYVKSFNHGNKRGVQYHPERTEQGIKELVDFLQQYAA